MQSSINNIYKLDGTVPIAKAIPFGLQHILAMFVSNLTPITLIATSAQPALTQAQIAILLQNAMFVAGIATLIQLYPIWKIFATMSSGKFKKGQALSKKAVFHSACPFLIHVFCLALFETQNYNILDGGAKWII